MTCIADVFEHGCLLSGGASSGCQCWSFVMIGSNYPQVYMGLDSSWIGSLVSFFKGLFQIAYNMLDL